MKTTTELLLLAAASAIVFTASCSDSPARPDASVAPATGSTEVSDPPEDDDPPQVWPQVIEECRIKVTFYEPQVESWDGAQLVARLAVSVETAASPEPHYGTIWVSAHTHVFKEEHLAVLQSPTVMRAAFPSAPGLTDEWLALIRKHLPDVRVWELDRLEASAAASTSKATPRAVVLNNDPPPIFFSRSPALLVLIDGPPAQRRVPGTQIQRVINTRALLLVEGEAAPTFYLGIGSRWLKAEALEGPWTLVRRTPYGLEVANKLAVDAKLVDLHENDPEMSRIFERDEVPQIIVSTRPAELIVTKGEPQFAPVPGTKLLWARNTDANIFRDTQTGLVYVLIGGRWFRAPSADGPWTFVGPGQLPADFARIPEADPAGEVLASVPGTPQAEEAVIANGIPQTAQIDRARARLETTYDGDPQFE